MDWASVKEHINWRLEQSTIEWNRRNPNDKKAYGSISWNSWVEEHLKELLDNIIQRGYNECFLFLYIDWFYGFKHIRNTSTLGLLFGVGAEGNENLSLDELLDKFFDWYNRNSYRFWNEDDCFKLAFEHRMELTKVQNVNQVYGKHERR